VSIRRVALLASVPRSGEATENLTKWQRTRVYESNYAALGMNAIRTEHAERTHRPNGQRSF
jgi:hypothetical protein